MTLGDLIITLLDFLATRPDNGDEVMARLDEMDDNIILFIIPDESIPDEDEVICQL